MTVRPFFAVGLDGKCGIGEQRLQGGPDRDRLPAAAAPVSGTIDSKNRIFVDVRFAPQAAVSSASPVGPLETCRLRLAMSNFDGEAENICSH
jgi:hypothetical protein